MWHLKFETQIELLKPSLHFFSDSFFQSEHFFLEKKKLF